MAAKKQVPLRLDEDDHRFVVEMSKHNNRSMNGELEYAIKQSIKRFKKENPELQMDVLTK